MSVQVEKLVEKWKNTGCHLSGPSVVEGAVRGAVLETRRATLEEAVKVALAWEPPPKHSNGCCCSGCDRIGDPRTDIAAAIQALITV